MIENNYGKFHGSGSCVNGDTIWLRTQKCRTDGRKTPKRYTPPMAGDNIKVIYGLTERLKGNSTHLHAVFTIRGLRGQRDNHGKYYKGAHLDLIGLVSIVVNTYKNEHKIPQNTGKEERVYSADTVIDDELEKIFEESDRPENPSEFQYTENVNKTITCNIAISTQSCHSLVVM
ncbi:hypothetical protein DPMN_137939 [Dreissena polymorpha]|uniref:Uncharacterized protein n=1 Tax=Dreissena polymorpha TaxID=45954 RepID=A0A9D4G3D6_DREPO|nr:hypothetical protein DPMN_137939 [Dreissena polymorpha]